MWRGRHIWLYCKMPRVAESYYKFIQKKLAEGVRNRRKQLGLTQEAAAHAIGIATRHYQKIEAGEVNVTLQTLAQIAKSLDIEIRDLFPKQKQNE